MFGCLFEPAKHHRGQSFHKVTEPFSGAPRPRRRPFLSKARAAPVTIPAINTMGRRRDRTEREDGRPFPGHKQLKLSLQSESLGEKQILNAKLASIILDAANLGREVTRLCPFWDPPSQLNPSRHYNLRASDSEARAGKCRFKNATLLSLLKILGNVIPGPMAMDTVPQRMQRRTAEIQN